MTRMKTQAWAALVASSMLASTMGIAAGGGYAVSQIGHNGHGQRGPMDNDGGRR